MTGLSLDTLRGWERRYQAVTPRRNARGRVYDDRDVARLAQLARLVDQGHAIGAIAGLGASALDRLINGAAPAATPANPRGVDLASLMQAIKQYDLPAVDAVLNRHSVVLPPDTLIFSVVLPILREAGARWEVGSIRPAHEHLVTAIIRSVLGGLLRTMPRWPDGDMMVFATLPGERHELGLLCAAVLAAHAGHTVTYLGPDLPAADILHVVNAIAASTLVVSATLPEVTSVRDVRQLRRLPPTVALWSGGGHGARVRREVGAHVRPITDLEQFARLVDRRRR